MENYTRNLYSSNSSNSTMHHTSLYGNSAMNIEVIRTESQLHVAVRYGSLETVRYLIRLGGDVSCLNSEGFTPLHLAIRRQDRAIIDQVLASDHSCFRNTNPADPYGFTHFHAACMRNNPKKVESFLWNGVDVNSRVNPTRGNIRHCSYEPSILVDDHVAAYFKQNELTNVELGPNVPEWSPNYTALHFAVESNCPDVVKLLIRHGANIGVKDYAGKTPLHLAAIYSRKTIMKILIRRGAKVNVKCHKGKTPLHYAVIYGKADAVELLLDLGADFNAEDVQGKTAWLPEYLAFYKEIDLVYCARVRDIDARDQHGETLLHKAIRRKRLEQVKILIRRGANINYTLNDQDLTPLHLAALCDSTEIVEVLLKNGADAAAKRRDGGNVLHSMAYRCPCPRIFYNHVNGFELEPYTNMIKALTRHGCKINATDAEGRTPLHIASMYSNVPAVRDLLESGADINIEDFNGETHVSFDSTILHDDFDMNRVFMLHITLLVTLNLRVNQKILDTPGLYSNDADRVRILLTFQKELERTKKYRMKAKHTGEVFSMHDVIFASDSRMALLVATKGLRKILERTDFVRIFPCYSSLIKLKIRKGVTKRAVEMAKQFFIDSVPDLCSAKICSYLTEKEVDAVIAATHR